MRVGLAAVAVRASGVEEVVVDGETGLLTKPEARDLADAAIGLLVDPARRAAMGRGGPRDCRARLLGGGAGGRPCDLYAELRG
jgi:glycosyltransferase involved in cell wall biosynthesis